MLGCCNSFAPMGTRAVLLFEVPRNPIRATNNRLQRHTITNLSKKQVEVSVRSLQDRDGKIRLWFDGRYDHLVDLRGNTLAIVKNGVVRNLRYEHVAFWRKGNVVDFDGRVLLWRGYRNDGPKHRVLPALVKCDDPSRDISRQVRKAWGSEIAFVETLRLASLEYLQIGRG
jgi:hypothetical protein